MTEQQQFSPTRAEQRAQREIRSVEQTTCCIVGGGPAGVMLAYLLARKGVPVILLEAHMDFDRDFRGDTLHPSVMEILDELGLADQLLQFRHTKLSTLTAQGPEGPFTFGRFDALKTKYPYITILAQSRFLEFMTETAKKYPTFHLVMGAQVDELIEENGKVCGVRYRGQDGWYEVHAALTVGADGRFSRMRKLSGFEPIKTSPPMDVLWFRMSRKADDPPEMFARFGNGEIVVMIDRFDYWQGGYVIPKGGYQHLKAEGIEHVRQALTRMVPDMADRFEELKEWKQFSVLSVESSRLPRWYRPGLLLIGDAAHVMSPVGGVGINYAIQDAVVAANLLSEKLKQGTLQTRDLAAVQRQRELPTRIIQAVQQFMQDSFVGRVLKQEKPLKISPLFRLALHIPFVRTLPARMVAFGPFPAHVKA
jgi:2-polyprenyl-6-methoxyphenol hydroxylase-like FAD-dependent oxidoreductase